MQKDTLKIENLHAIVDEKQILKGITLNIKAGEIHAIMGPNGSGKSTLCNVLMGHPKYKLTKGSICLNGKNIKNMNVNKRANAGLFLAFQQPMEIPGVSFGNFLRLAKNANLKANDKNANPIGPVEFLDIIKKTAKALNFKKEFIGRAVNEGFSGGEKKQAEIIQMAILKPKFAILDEIDSGLDIDALKSVANGIKKIFKETNPGILLITHYQRILNYIKPHYVHILHNGQIIKSGTKKLAHELEKKGYKNFIK